MSRLTYLDYNATAPVRPAVIEAMREALGRVGNPSSVHRFGREARRERTQEEGIGRFCHGVHGVPERGGRSGRGVGVEAC